MIHNMARSGGTLVCKCLACMDGVALLSEIHPAAIHKFNPLQQAIEWHDLLSEQDKAALRQRGNIDFQDAIELITRRAEEKGLALVLRDWAHLDFTGYPFNPNPSYRPALHDVLAGRFDILRAAIVRDPVDQWLSLTRLVIWQKYIQRGEFTLAKFLAGYRKFAELGQAIGFIRYEDFTRDPDRVMQGLCAHLQLQFDPGYAVKWQGYTKISGDIVNSRGVMEGKIIPLSRKPLSPELREAFLANEDYLVSISLLGYESL